MLGEVEDGGGLSVEGCGLLAVRHARMGITEREKERENDYSGVVDHCSAAPTNRPNKPPSFEYPPCSNYLNKYKYLVTSEVRVIKPPPFPYSLTPP